jgi:hypothetical protein
MTPSLAFTIKTIPNITGLRTLLGVPTHATDSDVANIAFHQRRQQNGSEFLPLHQHQICAISCAIRTDNQFKVWTLGEKNISEKAILQSFFDVINQNTLKIISWNGSDFDIPVLLFRSMINQVQVPHHLHLDDKASSIDINPNHHLDLMRLLLGERDDVPLADIVQLCGFPTHLDMNSSKTWLAFEAGDIEAISMASETEVVSLQLVYLRYQLMRGYLTATAYEVRIKQILDTLSGYQGQYWQAFVDQLRAK